MRKAITIIVFIAFIPLVIVGLYKYSQQATQNIEQDIISSVEKTLMRDGFSGQYGEQIFISVDGRDVLLEGEAPNQSIKNAIEETVRSVYGVRKVQSDMNVAQAKAAPITQTNDTTKNAAEDTPAPQKGISLSNALSDTPITTKTNNSVLKETVVIDTIACDPDVCDAVKKSHEKPMVEENQ